MGAQGQAFRLKMQGISLDDQQSQRLRHFTELFGKYQLCCSNCEADRVGQSVFSHEVERVVPGDSSPRSTETPAPVSNFKLEQSDQLSRLTAHFVHNISR